MILAIVLISVFALIVSIFFAVFASKSARHSAMFDYNHIIQKRTSTLFFDVNGFLLSDNDSTNREHALGSLRTGDNISSFTQNPDMATYLRTCARYRGNLSYKVEEIENNLVKRTDLVFSPFISDGVLRGVSVTSQTVYAKNREAELLEKARDLANRNNEAQRLIEKLDSERANLEAAFKKSSRHHIQLQKAMYRIEEQNRELEKAIDTINKQKTELERVNAEIRRSNKMKEVFLANTSHEIRTPLNAIIGFTKLLLKMNPNEQQLKYLENIETSGRNLLFIINDILDLSKIEAGKMVLESTDFDLRDLVDKCVNALSVRHHGKEITINVDIDNTLPPMLVGDPYRINQILTNLLNNSIKFTGDDCVINLKINVIKMGAYSIEIGVEVSDNGIGIPKDRQSEIFKSFTQANADTTRKYGGTGLGLSITRQLVEMYGGEISVESEPDHGATFRFNLILKPSGAQTSELSTVSSQPATDKPLRILLAEDNEINQQLAIDTLKLWNPNVIIDIAVNGQVAVAKVVESAYDVVLMDIQMPVMDGNEAARAIRNSQSLHSKVPIIAMTAHAFKEEHDRCLTNGMNDYVAKPFDPDVLIAKICKYAGIEQDNTAGDETNGEPMGVAGVFNIKTLFDACNGDKTELRRVFGIYTTSIPDDISALTAAYKNGDTEKIRFKHHALLTTFGYLGMTSAAEALEKATAEDSDVPQLLEQISTECQNKLPMIKEFVESL
ncbi:MAG: response regulator [Salinivirgaceae bacterium]|nr:response regulator [Salinivirgaceae bacterium]